MNTPFIARPRVKKLFLRLSIGFGLFFFFRLGYNYLDDGPMNHVSQETNAWAFKTGHKLFKTEQVK